MPQRRSQNLPLDDSLTPSRAFERRRKSTTRAEQPKITDRAAFFALSDRRRRVALISSNVDESRLSSSSELPSLSRRSESSSLRRSRSDSFSLLSRSRYWEDELGISKDRAERSIAFSAAEVAARAKLQKEQQDWNDAAQRLRDNKACEETLWQAEIDEHDEQETIHRRHLNRQTRKKAEKLPISELEVMNFEDRVDDSMLSISACLRVNRRLEWSSHIAQMLTSKFQIWSFEEILDETIRINDDDVKSWIITNRMIVIKANRSKVIRKQQSIDDFSELEWDKVLLALTEKKATDYTIKIEVNAKAEKPTRKRPAEVVSEDSDADERSRQRRTRIDQLLNRARIRSDTLADVDNFDRALLNRWQCNDEHCRNQNDFCFVNFAGKHYNIDHTQQSLWSKAISNGEANVSIERSSTSLYNFWSDKQSSVTSLSRRSDLHEERLNVKAERVKKKDFMTRFTRFNEQQMEMRMSEAMADQIERMNSRQKASEPHSPSSQQSSLPQWSSWQQSSIYSFYQLPYQPWQQPSQPSSWQQPLQLPSWQQPSQSIQWQQPSSAQSTSPSSSSSSSLSSLSSQPAIAAQRSSLIEESEETKEIFDQFFAWKISKISRQAIKQKLAKVRLIVNAQMWSTNDLKDMTDSTSDIYRTAIQLEVSDEMTRAFKKDLKLFKPIWREVKTLLELSR